MKLRHAAALALVGWYLMCPPLQSQCAPGVETLRNLLGKKPDACETKIRNYDASISEWDQLDEYDTAAECRTQASVSSEVPCKCIGTNDPRLRKGWW
jgi:hypothetical protein